MDFPHDFITRTRRWLDDYLLLESTLQQDAPVSIRIHPAKHPAPLPYEQVAWCETGYYLPERPAFTFDPLFHAGAYYVQEAASMFLEQVVRQYVTSPVCCLDLCAAPGGKATHLLSLLPEKSLLVANEVIRSRVDVLTENILKWGSPYAFVTHNDPEEIGRLTHLFDVIVADLPCSGEGMFRKDAASRHEWSISGVQRCAARQRRIIHDVWNALAPGGICIYSTCTFNREENEENIRCLAGQLPAEVVPVSIVEKHGQISRDADDRYPSCRFFPHRTKGEGFFLAVLRKPDGKRNRLPVKMKNKPSPHPPVQAGEWLSDAGAYQIRMEQTLIRAIPNEYVDLSFLLAGHLRVIASGIPAGEQKGKDLRPSQALAWSTAFRREVFPSVGLAWKEAIHYLQKEAPVLPENMPKGYAVVTCRGLPLGFVKNVGHRANNLYPQEWRIRSRNLPEKAPDVLPPLNNLSCG